MLHVISKKLVCTLPVAMLMLGMTAAKADIVSTIQAAKSGTTVTCSGTYTNLGKCTVPSGVTVKGPATFIFKSSSTDGFYIASGTTGVTLQSLTVTHANHGILIYGNSNTISSCVATGDNNDGIITENTAANNKITGCASYNNCDIPNGGGNADGFGNKQNTGTGNTWTNCTCYNNSDDGFDFERSSGAATLTGCVSYSNGDCNGVIGNGNGFKMGYSGYKAANVYVSCVAHHSTNGDSPHGFSQNNGTGACKLTTCHSYSNTSKDVLNNCTLTNCTMET